jgi:hypothetical protein
VLFAIPARADLMQANWKPAPAEGVELKLSRDQGRTGDDGLRLDFDFKGRGGYAIARRDGAIEPPENFELSFWIRGEAPRNTLEVKLVGGDNVWWHVRREMDFPREWRRISIKKRQFEFAWGPSGPGPLPGSIDALEIVVTAGTGGKGTVWLDDVQIEPLETLPDGPPPKITNVPWQGRAAFSADFGRRHEIGGLIIDWTRAPASYEIATDRDGVVKRVTSASGGRDFVHLPDVDARTVAIRFEGDAAIRDVRVLPPVRNDNEFFALVAKESRRGDFPRYLYGEQSYWTVIGGKNGEMSEALISEDGRVEAGNARFSIEPFLWIEKELVTWNDVDAEPRTGASVSWKKHLTITPRLEGGTLHIRYVAAPNAKLVLAIRPFQVNPSWQFLGRTGGTVKVTRIEREGNAIRVDGDESITVTAPIASFGATEENIVEDLREQKLPAAQKLTGDFLSAAMTFDSTDVTISFPLSPANRPLPAANWLIEVPAEPRIGATLRAQLDFILINRDGPSIQPGSRSYERSWIRDGSLTSAALLRVGRADVVREFMEWYAKAIRDDGYVPCCVSAGGLPDPVPEHDSHGQFIYLVAEHYRHTRDRAVAEAMWPKVQKVVAFIDKLRHERMTERYRGTPFYGLVPESISHEGYSAKPMHSYWDDFFILGGLKDAAFLARELGKVERARYESLRDEFRRDLLASIRMAMAQHEINYIPGSVELGDFDATSTTVALNPVGEMDSLPQDALRATFDRYYDQALGPRNYTPYEWRTVGTFVRLGERDKARALAQYFFEDQRPAAWHQWAEVVYRDPREPGFIGDMPHTWVGSDFMRSIFDMFVYEEDDALVLGAGVPDAWLDQGVTVDNISTHFGPVGYRLRREGGRVVLRLTTKPKGRVVVGRAGVVVE